MVAEPLIAIGVVFFSTFILTGFTSPLLGWGFAQAHRTIGAVVIPDVLALFVLFWAVVVARRITLG